MTTPIKLYRGDSEYIERFEVAKTHKFCLFGQGIYLTADIGVAGTYVTKGTSNSSEALRAFPGDDRFGILISRRLYDSKDDDKSAATKINRPLIYAMSFHSYVTTMASYGNDPHRVSVAKQAKEFFGDDWYHKDGKEIMQWIIAQFGAGVYSPKANLQRILPALRQYVDDIHNGIVTTNNSGMVYTALLDFSTIERVGAVSKFVFNKDELDAKTINIDLRTEAWCKSEQFWADAYDRRLPIGIWTVYSGASAMYQNRFFHTQDHSTLRIATKEEYIALNTNLSPNPRAKSIHSSFALADLAGPAKKSFKLASSVDIWKKVRTLAKAHGFIGYRHTGGVVTGGRPHRVYVLWDDDYVADHRLE